MTNCCWVSCSLEDGEDSCILVAKNVKQRVLGCPRMGPRSKHKDTSLTQRLSIGVHWYTFRTGSVQTTRMGHLCWTGAFMLNRNIACRLTLTWTAVHTVWFVTTSLDNHASTNTHGILPKASISRQRVNAHHMIGPKAMTFVSWLVQVIQKHGFKLDSNRAAGVFKPFTALQPL